MSAGRQPEAMAPAPIGLRTVSTGDGTASRQVSSIPATGDRNVCRAIVGSPVLTFEGCAEPYELSACTSVIALCRIMWRW